jgi:SAM-dependent methyltransferase
MTAGRLSQCPVCGGSAFTSRKILWPELVHEWQLAPHEAAYVDEQQGLACCGCGCNLRSMTLAAALMQALRFEGTFEDFCASSEPAGTHRLLEINEAGNLTPYLRRFRNYTPARYPEFDMQRMHEHGDRSIDIIVHSDTLEHVPDPEQALRECARVLTARGVMAFTVPIIVGRASRRRDGLPPSYHGNAAQRPEDFRVVTEYGADAWCQVLSAGFRKVTMHSILYPQSIAIIAGL